MYSLGIAYLLWFLSFFGIFGFHRFYLGKIPTGILWMCTGGLSGIGSIYDLLTLPRQVEEANMRRNIRAQFHAAPGGASGWRTVDDGDIRIVRETESAEKRILLLAKNRGGILSPAAVALETDLSIDEAKKELEALVSRGFAEIRVRSSGALVYTFPEFMNPDAPLEDF